MTLEAQAKATVKQQRYEQLLCAAAALQPDYTRQSCGWLKPEIISDPACRKFWAGFIQHGNVDRAALDASIYSALAEWQGDALVRDASAAPELARKVSEQAWLANIVAPHMSKLARSVTDGDAEQTRELLRQLNKDNGAAPGEIPTTARTHEKFMAALRDGRRVLPTRTRLDKFMGGLERQSLTVLAGMTGAGKSAFAFQLARNVAAQGEHVAFFSLEMSEVSLWARAACGALRWNWDDIKARAQAKELSKADETKIERTSADLRDKYACLHIYEDAQTTESIWQNVAGLRPGLVVVDHARLVNDKSENETIRLGRVTWRLKEMSKALDCSVLCLVQLNRSSYTREDKHPTLADIRQSGEIAENSDDVLALYRKKTDDGKDQEPDMNGNVIAELWFLKHRTGSSNAYAAFNYNLPEQWFYDLE
jgi:KaiC/GvpD/RAD55 family RecA-like ATPase